MSFERLSVSSLRRFRFFVHFILPIFLFSLISGNPLVSSGPISPLPTTRSLSQMGKLYLTHSLGSEPWRLPMDHSGWRGNSTMLDVTDDRGLGQRSAREDGEEGSKGLILKLCLHSRHTFLT